MKKDRMKFDMGSLENISPSNFHEKVMPFTPKLGEENKNGENENSGNKDFSH